MKQLNLIERYSVVFLNGSYVSEFHDTVGVELAFYNEGYGITVLIINKKIDDMDSLSNIKKEIIYGFKLSELNDVSKHPTEFNNLFDFIKEKLNWDNLQLNISIGLFQEGILPTSINKFTFDVNDIDEAMRVVEPYCEFIDFTNFDNFKATLIVETQLERNEILNMIKKYIS